MKLLGITPTFQSLHGLLPPMNDHVDGDPWPQDAKNTWLLPELPLAEFPTDSARGMQTAAGKLGISRTHTDFLYCGCCLLRISIVLAP